MNEKTWEAQPPEIQSPTPEAGVAEVMALYETIEAIYFAASSVPDLDTVYTSNSTNAARVNGYVG